MLCRVNMENNPPFNGKSSLTKEALRGLDNHDTIMLENLFASLIYLCYTKRQ